MVITVRAITAKSSPVAVDNLTQLIAQYLGATGFAGDMIREMANYPPQQATFGARQSLGASFGNPRRKRASIGGRGYRRTGTLGRNWRLDGPRQTATGIAAGASNRTKYAVYVEGPVPGEGRGKRQTAVMREKGWPDISSAVRRIWPKHRIRIVRVLTQRDPAVRRQRLS